MSEMSVEYLTQDKGIAKVLISPGTSSVVWEKGANARLHYKVFAYPLPSEPEPEPKETCQEEETHKEHSHEHGHKGCHHHHPKEKMDRLKSMFDEMLSPSKASKEPQVKAIPAHLLNQKPIKVTVSDTRDLMENGDPFELRIGYKFSVVALETCVTSMKVGERARFLCTPKYCDGFVSLETVLRQEKRNRENIVLGLPPVRYSGCAAHVSPEMMQENKDLMVLEGAPLEFDIELLQVQSPRSFQKQVWEMGVEDKWAEIPIEKEAGSQLYRIGDIKGAIAKYERALSMIEALSKSTLIMDLKKEQMDLSRGLDVEITQTPVKLDQMAEWNKICRLNYAACKLKVKEYDPVIIQCTEVLKDDSKCIKALFRRAQAYLKKGRDLDLAQNDLDMLGSIFDSSGISNGAPERLELLREQSSLNVALKAHAAKETKMYGGMFK